MYRTGSRIRVRISAPNGDQPVWSFSEPVPSGQANVEIGYGGDMQSRLELPVVPGASAPTALPPCPGLRGEPCRDYQPFENATATLESSSPDQGGSASGGQSTNGSTGNAPAKRCKKAKHRAAAASKRCKRKR
jgi:hypothetical protein